jgi:hypothetical protein
MKYFGRFGRFWYDFIVGDDWRLAIGVVAAIAVVHEAVLSDSALWWLLPVAIAALLTVSVRSAARNASRVRRSAR